MASKEPAKKAPKKKFPALTPTPLVEELCAPLVGITGDMKSLITALKDVATNLQDAGLDMVELAVAREYMARLLKEQKLVHSPGKLVGTVFRMVTPKKDVEGQDAIEPDPDPWPDEIDGAALLSELRNRFARYVVLPPGAAVHCALDCLRTHVYDCFEHNPFHIIESPIRGCGKTLLAQVKRCLVRRAPVKLTSHITGPGLVRLIDKEHPSVLLDEGDAAQVDQKFRAILDSAHTKAGASVGINVPRPDGSWDYRDFSTWAPLTIALIQGGSHGHLNPTILSRGIRTRLKKKLPMDLVAPLGPKEEAELFPLKRCCIRWAQDNLAALRYAPKPSMPADLTDDRAQDCWRPLLIIADLVGGDWPALAREAAVLLSGGEQDDASLGVTLLRALRDLFGDRAQLPSEYILRTLNADEEGPWSERGKKGITGNDLTRLLDGFVNWKNRDNRPLNFPKDDWDAAWGPYRAKAKGYKRSLFEDAWVHYLVPPVPLKDLYIEGSLSLSENGQPPEKSVGVLQPPSGGTGSTGDPMQEPAP